MVETEPDDSSDQESEIEYDDDSSSDDDTFDFDDIHEGDFVVVNYGGRKVTHCTLHCPMSTEDRQSRLKGRQSVTETARVRLLPCVWTCW